MLLDLLIIWLMLIMLFSEFYNPILIIQCGKSKGKFKGEGQKKAGERTEGWRRGAARVMKGNGVCVCVCVCGGVP